MKNEGKGFGIWIFGAISPSSHSYLGKVVCFCRRNYKVSILEKKRQLNAFLHRIDQNADPSCRRGCEALENVQHVLLDCRSLDEHRRKIVSFFSSNSLHLDLTSLLGLNLQIPVSCQFRIRNLLTQYLAQTKLIEFI